jgi:hypothetical protein
MQIGPPFLHKGLDAVASSGLGIVHQAALAGQRVDAGAGKEVDRRSTDQTLKPRS